MKLIAPSASTVSAERRGSALLMAFLMLIVLYAIVFQLWFSTSADLRVAQNDVTSTQMDLAIESSLQEVYDRLKTDGEAGGAAGADSAGGAAAGGASAAPGGGAAPAAGGESAPVDSREDSWGKPQRATIGEIELRILVQDEDAKINLLGMLADDEDEAEACFERVARVIDMFRDGSAADIDRSEALRIAESIRTHLKHRSESSLPKPKLLSDNEDKEELGMPLTLKEFEILDRLDPGLFRDFRDERGYIVHSLGAYLTVWSSVISGPGAGAVGGAGGAAGGSGANAQGGAANSAGGKNTSGGNSGNSSGQSGTGAGGTGSGGTGGTGSTGGAGSGAAGGGAGGESSEPN